jgi:hypothetical protein
MAKPKKIRVFINFLEDKIPEFLGEYTEKKAIKMGAVCVLKDKDVWSISREKIKE